MKRLISIVAGLVVSANVMASAEMNIESKLILLLSNN